MSSSRMNRSPKVSQVLEENMVLFSGSRRHTEFIFWALNLFIKYFVCIKKTWQHKKCPVQMFQEGKHANIHKSCKYWCVCASSFQMSLPRISSLCVVLKHSHCFRKKRFLFIIYGWTGNHQAAHINICNFVIYYSSLYASYFLCLRCTINSILSAPSA